MTETQLTTSLPKKQMMVVFFVQMCEAMNITVLFPFLAFMVEDFGYTGHHLGMYAGFLAATFCGAQFFTAAVWGNISDRYGRRPAITIGVLGSAVGMLTLGLSTSYSQAILGRAISGILSGNLGVLKSFLTEITDDSNRGSGFSLLSIGWSAGAILGPLLGGLLCYPADKYPSTFASLGLFAKHAFLLPCLVCVLGNLLTGMYCFLCMEESKENIEATSCDMCTYVPIGLFDMNISQNGGWGSYLHVKEEEGNEDLDIGVAMSDAIARDHGEMAEISQGYEDTASSSTDADNGSSLTDQSLNTVQTFRDAMNIDVVLSVAAYGLCCMGFIIIDETAPLMMKLDRSEGGLSFSSSLIGAILAVGGAVMMLWTTIFLPRISSSSKLYLFKLSAIASVPMTLLFPLIASCDREILEVAGEVWGQRVVVVIFVLALIVRNCVSTVMFLAVTIFVNHSATSVHLGLVNGVGQSVASFARAAGPALGGVLWSYSVRIHFLYVNYLATVVVFIVIYAVVARLPSSIDFKKKKETEICCDF